MPRPSRRRAKAVSVKLPGGRTTVHYKDKRPGPARCAICHAPLGGVPRLRPSELRKLPKSSRRPERPGGGYICHRCLQYFLKMEARRMA